MSIRPKYIKAQKWRAAWQRAESESIRKRWFDYQWDGQREEFRIVLADGVTVEYRSVEDMLGGNHTAPPENDELWLVCPECGAETPYDEEFCKNESCEHFFSEVDN